MPTTTPTTSDRPTPGGATTTAAAEPLHPGDDAPAGTPGTGENVCRACGGDGNVDGKQCAECGGTGKVTVGVGGA